MRRPKSLPLPFIAFALCVAFGIVAGALVLHGSDDQGKHVTVLGKRIELTASQQLGHQVFAEHCASCHTLAASHSVGVTGPDLDSIHPSDQLVQSIVTSGLVAQGVMPSGLATGPQLAAVASYVSRVANPKAYHP